MKLCFLLLLLLLLLLFFLLLLFYGYGVLINVSISQCTKYRAL